MLAWLGGHTAAAQTTMCIDFRDGSRQEIALSRIDSITFTDTPQVPPQQETSLEGAWFWGKREAGYYELLTMNADRTYTGYDLYLDYGIPTQTYGVYWLMGSMLYLQSNAVGYKRIYRWFLTGLTANALDVVTEWGRFTYFRVQPEAIRLSANSQPVSPPEGDSYLFADGLCVDIDADGNLKPLAPGTTYVTRHTAATNTTVALKVIIEP